MAKYRINTALLKGVLTANNMSVLDLGRSLGLAQVTIYRKVNGQRQFTVGELYRIKELLGLDHDMIDRIFYPEIILSKTGA